MNSKGFTIVELLIVIIMLAIVAGTAVISLNGSSQRYANLTARQRIIQEIRGARAEAITRNTYVDFALVNAAAGLYAVRELNRTGANTYTIVRVIRNNIPIGDQYTTSNVVFLNLSNESIGGVNVTGIVFDNHGRVDNPNGAPTIRVTTNTVNRIINIATNTGYIR